MYWLLALLALGACAQDVTVVQETAALGQEYVLQVHAAREHVLHFAPSVAESAYPVRVQLRAEGAADLAHPLLVTARHRTGATTWQLPYQGGNTTLWELQRTLCPTDVADQALDGNSNCDTETDANGSRRGAFSLHVAASCAEPASLRLRADLALDFELAVAAPAHVTATPAAPGVRRFRAWGASAAVRLVLSSADAVCATVVVQPVDCPIAQSAQESLAHSATLRMTVLRSGGLQLAKTRFPNGFYVTTLVEDSEEVCGGSEEAQGDEGLGEGAQWLWQAALFNESAPSARADDHARVKLITYEIQEALTWREYLLGVGVAMAFFAAWYAAFGALVLAQRWPAWYNLVGPRAPREAAAPEELRTVVDSAPAAEGEGRGLGRRRDSTATFDSSDLSDTDSEHEDTATTSAPASPAAPASASAPASPAALAPASATVPAIASARAPDQPDGVFIIDDGEQQGGGGNWEPSRPFGLPAAGALRVARLARRRTRVLEARSRRYLAALATVAVFYALPVLQFVAAFQLVLHASGSLDLCYYNWLCAHPLGALADFNHVYSNLGYLLLGALYMVQLRRRTAAGRRTPGRGLPPRAGLHGALGAGMMVVALLSASYHVCPNQLNFQFDTAFMYVLAALSCVAVYQARHPDINARAHSFFGFLAVLLAIVVWGVLAGGALFWAVLTVVHIFSFLLVSLRIYYLGQLRLAADSVARAARAAVRARAPLYRARLATLLLANAVHWAFALYGLLQRPAVASHLLFVLLATALLHILYYVCMKLLHGEHIRWYAWCYLAGAALTWAPALWMFTWGSSDWAASPAQSRHRNHECLLLAFYDAHDLWHMLSAAALYLTFGALLTLDDGLGAVPTEDIHVF